MEAAKNHDEHAGVRESARRALQQLTTPEADQETSTRTMHSEKCISTLHAPVSTPQSRGSIIEGLAPPPFKESPPKDDGGEKDCASVRSEKRDSVQDDAVEKGRGSVLFGRAVSDSKRSTKRAPMRGRAKARNRFSRAQSESQIEPVLTEEVRESTPRTASPKIEKPKASPKKRSRSEHKILSQTNGSAQKQPPKPKAQARLKRTHSEPRLRRSSRAAEDTPPEKSRPATPKTRRSSQELQTPRSRSQSKDRSCSPAPTSSRVSPFNKLAGSDSGSMSTTASCSSNGAPSTPLTPTPASSAASSTPRTARSRTASQVPANAQTFATAQLQANNHSLKRVERPGWFVAPADLRATFCCSGHGHKLIRRLLEQKGWKCVPHEESNAISLKFHLKWCARKELEPIWNRLQPWQLVCKFPHAMSTISSKMGLHKRLQLLCPDSYNSNEESSCSGGIKLRPLHELCPRSYDLRSCEELRAFLLDFALTRAEAQLRRILGQDVKETSLGQLASIVGLLRLVGHQLESRGGPPPRRLSTARVNLDNFARAEASARTGALFGSGLEWLCTLGLCPTSSSHLESPARSEGDSEELVSEGTWWLEFLKSVPVRQPGINGENSLWVLKAPHVDCGRGVSMHSELIPMLLEARKNRWHMCIQKCVEEPLIVGDDKRKCDVRLWVLVTSWNPAIVWVHPEPYFRLAQKPYSFYAGTLKDPFIHLTNRTVQKTQDGTSPKANGSLSVRSVDEDYIWLLPRFFKWMEEGRGEEVQYLTMDEEWASGSVQDAWYLSTWPRMLQAVRSAVLACQPDLAATRFTSFELLGFDFILDRRMQPWLLETNSSPDMCLDSGPSLRNLCEWNLAEMLSIVIGLHEGTMHIPSNIPVEADQATPGSGKWRLCLRETADKSALARSARRASGRAASNPFHNPFLNVMFKVPAGDDSHDHVLQELLRKPDRAMQDLRSARGGGTALHRLQEFRLMGNCAAPQQSVQESGTSPAGMARVVKVGQPSQCDPTGTGMIVNDILTPWRFYDTDPFILLHEFGPIQSGGMNIPIGMHPHRGFNEAPYLKQGQWVGTDAWKPQGDPAHPMRSGSFQWGFIGSGIEHGVNFDRTYTGPIHGFQLWVNLPEKQKMDPPCFQDSEPDALPVVRVSEKAEVKILAGEVAGQKSPVNTGTVRMQYLDFMLQAGADISHTLPDGYTSVFVYVYAGQGCVGTREAKRGDVLRVEPCGPLALTANRGDFGLLLLAGVPLGEKIVQHGPFVMATKEQIQQTFRDYQSGRFLDETCKYVLHTAAGSVPSQLSLRR